MTPSKGMVAYYAQNNIKKVKTKALLGELQQIQNKNG